MSVLIVGIAARPQILGGFNTLGTDDNEGREISTFAVNAITGWLKAVGAVNIVGIEKQVVVGANYRVKVEIGGRICTLQISRKPRADPEVGDFCCAAALPSPKANRCT